MSEALNNAAPSGGANEAAAPDPRLAEAIALAGAERRDEAHALFGAILADDADNVEALLWMGALADDPQESLNLIGRAVQLDPQNARARAALRWARKRLPNSAPLASPAASIAAPLAATSQPMPIAAAVSAPTLRPARGFPRWVLWILIGALILLAAGFVWTQTDWPRRVPAGMTSPCPACAPTEGPALPSP